MILSSKLTFSIIAISALFISGSAIMTQDAFATDAPEFTAAHINTTATKVTFDKAVNGTLRIADWHIQISTDVSGILQDGSGLTSGDIGITGITNGSTTSSTADRAVSGASTFGYINNTTVLYLIHEAIPTDSTYMVNFTNSEAVADTVALGQFHEYLLGRSGAAEVTDKVLKIGSNATAQDWISPIPVSAKKTGPKTIEILMSETVANINSTGSTFTISGSHDSVVSNIIATNGTKTIYLTTQNLINPITIRPTITLNYDSASGTTAGHAYWITDAVDSGNHTNSGVQQSAEWVKSGHGNRLYNFTGLSVTYPTDFVSDAERFSPHIHDEISVSINSDKVYDLKIHDGTTSNILAYVGDTVFVTVSIGDDSYLDQISKSTLITNYDNRPSDMNPYYFTNNNDMGQTGLSVYEWNQNTFDQNYDYAGVISWDEIIIKIDKRFETFHEFVGPLLISENELFITYSMTFDDVMPKSQVGIKISDTNYNNFESFLPFTLEVLPSDDVVTPKSIEEPIEDSTSPESDIVEITLSINNDSYENGDKVIVTGQIQNYDFNYMSGKNILYSVISPENIVLSSGQIGPNSDGSFYFTTFAVDTIWKTDGNYVFSTNLSSLKQTIDIPYDNTEFESLTFESESKATTTVTIIPEATTTVTIIPEATTTVTIIPEATTTVTIIPEATTTVTIIPEATTTVTIIPEATTELSNSNIMCGPGTESVNGICQVVQTTSQESEEGGGCLIATAAYGSEMSPQVQLLREIRDNQLMNTESGSAFMSTFNNAYYSFSPVIADMERESPIFKEVVKLGLTPMLSSLSLMENANSESEVLGLGLSVIALNLAMYLGIPAMIVVGIRKKF